MIRIRKMIKTAFFKSGGWIGMQITRPKGSDCLGTLRDSNWLDPLCFNAQGGMRNNPQPVLRDQFSGNPANSVCFVFNPDQGIFKRFDEFLLAGSKLAVLLLGKYLVSLFKHLESG